MNPKEAKKILPKAEYETFEPVLLNQMSRTGSKRLKDLATLSRRLRDKYRDLGRRQGAEVRTRRTNETDTTLHDRRVGLFQEIMNRLAEELENPRHRAPRRASSGVRKVRHAPGDETLSKRLLQEAKRR